MHGAGLHLQFSLRGEDAQTGAAHPLDVFRPLLDEYDVVTCRSEVSADGGTVGSGAEHGDSGLAHIASFRSSDHQSTVEMNTVAQGLPQHLAFRKSPLNTEG